MEGDLVLHDKIDGKYTHLHTKYLYYQILFYFQINKEFILNNQLENENEYKIVINPSDVYNPSNEAEIEDIKWRGLCHMCNNAFVIDE